MQWETCMLIVEKDSFVQNFSIAITIFFGTAITMSSQSISDSRVIIISWCLQDCQNLSSLWLWIMSLFAAQKLGYESVIFLAKVVFADGDGDCLTILHRETRERRDRGAKPKPNTWPFVLCLLPTADCFFWGCNIQIIVAVNRNHNCLYLNFCQTETKHPAYCPFCF